MLSQIPVIKKLMSNNCRPLLSLQVDLNKALKMHQQVLVSLQKKISKKKNATSIADLLVDVPGVDVRNGVGKTAGLNVSIRGCKQMTPSF